MAPRARTYQRRKPNGAGIGAGESVSGNGSVENNAGDAVGAEFTDPASARNAFDGNAPGNTTSTSGPSPRSRQKAPGKIDLTRVEAMLMGIHLMLAQITRVPELMLDQKEANLLASAAVDLSKHYPAMAQIMDSKTMDHVQFVSILAGVYGSRITAFNMRKAAEQKAKAENRPTNVVDMTQPRPA